MVRYKNFFSVENGSHHFLDLIRRSRFLQGSNLEVVNTCLQRNAFFANAENIILSLLTSPQLSTRQKGFQIHEIASETHLTVRKFELPTINFEAENLFELLDPKSLWHRPPILSKIPIEDISNAAKLNTIRKFITAIPCHSQNVERHVKLVTEASKHVCDANRRNEWIKNTIISRGKNPVWDTKSDFKLE